MAIRAKLVIIFFLTLNHSAHVSVVGAMGRKDTLAGVKSGVSK